MIVIVLSWKVFSLQAMEHLQTFIQDCDRKTELAKRRLKETQEELSEEANSKVNFWLTMVFIHPFL